MNINDEDVLRWKMMDAIYDLANYGMTAADIIEYATEYANEAVSTAFEASDLCSEAMMAYVDEHNPNEDISWGELADLQDAFLDGSDEYDAAYKRWEEDQS